MWFEWVYSGANKTVPRNAGPDCANFLDPSNRKMETVIVIICSLVLTIWGYTNMSLKSRYLDNEPQQRQQRSSGNDASEFHRQTTDGGGGSGSSTTTTTPTNVCDETQFTNKRKNAAAGDDESRNVRYRQRYRNSSARYCNTNNMTTKKALLMSMSLIWGMEIGYKFSSRTVIYLLNPCHVTTAIQIYLLAAAPSDLVTAVFRIHMNFLNGPLLAFLFPETDTRILPLEAAIYWIQHGMMVVVPYYLLQLGGVYHMEKINDFSWNAFGYGINALYHITILQAISIPTEVNLNHMLCPAILDPFSGPHYRKMGFLHQAILCPILCKLFCIVAYYRIKRKRTKQLDSVHEDIQNGHHAHTE